MKGEFSIVCECLCGCMNAICSLDLNSQQYPKLITVPDMMDRWASTIAAWGHVHLAEAHREAPGLRTWDEEAGPRAIKIVRPRMVCDDCAAPVIAAERVKAEGVQVDVDRIIRGAWLTGQLRKEQGKWQKGE